jgi:hypothetical protein
MRLFQPGPEELTPEQIIEMAELTDRDILQFGAGPHVPPNVNDLADVALGRRFSPAERRAARIELARVYAATNGDNIITRDPFSDMLCELAIWAETHRFDDDQDPGEDTPDERLVRAYMRWQALR